MLSGHARSEERQRTRDAGMDDFVSKPFTQGQILAALGRLTISLGIASFPADGVTSNELIHAADLALYRAKAMGRNRLVLFEPSIEEKSLPALRG